MRRSEASDLVPEGGPRGEGFDMKMEGIGREVDLVWLGCRVRLFSRRVAELEPGGADAKIVVGGQSIAASAGRDG